ncbi:MAG: hypothetical protein O6940_08625 [Ignavibacteria bacterium]|nr:hypothetical protein [Ignavibacteria bacterium]
MTTLDVMKLTSSNSDWEMNQYTLLSKVKEWESNFRKNRLYPHLNESIELNNKLEEILQENLESKWWLEKETRPRRVNNGYVVYKKANQVSHQLNQLLNFVAWALKLNRPVMQEGLILRDFIEDNMKISELDNDANYKGKGYFSLIDNKKSVVNIYLYDMKWDWQDDEPVQSLKINLMRSTPLLVLDESVEELMADFVNYSQPLYRPVAYIISNEFDFSYDETILPLAGEVLLKRIMS